MKILNVEPQNNSSSAVARFDVRMKVFGEEFDFPGFTYFVKGDSSWVAGSSRRYEKDGETRYQPFGGFVDSSVQRRFLGQVKEVFKKYLEQNPNMNPEPVVTDQNDEIPF
jgi:hypothetical protein